MLVFFLFVLFCFFEGRDLIFLSKDVSHSTLGLGMKPLIMLLRTKSEAGAPVHKALLSQTAQCPASIPLLAHGLPVWVEAAFHPLPEVMPKYNSSELIISPSSED